MDQATHALRDVPEALTRRTLIARTLTARETPTLRTHTDLPTHVPKAVQEASAQETQIPRTHTDLPTPALQTRIVRTPMAQETQIPQIHTDLLTPALQTPNARTPMDRRETPIATAPPATQDLQAMIMMIAQTRRMILRRVN